jgi:hypothetical protein
MPRAWDAREAMRIMIGAAFVAVALVSGAPAIAGDVPPTRPYVARGDAIDATARRLFRRNNYRPSYQPHYPTYYARPIYYRPYPYGVPVPFFLGFAYLPDWRDLAR